MHDLKLWRDDPDALDAALARRKIPPLARGLLERERELRGLQTELQEQQARRNALSKEIGRLRSQGGDAAALIAEVGSLAVQPDSPARVVVDERTGTIVIGNDVRISTVAVAHGNLTVRVTETPKASQPLPFSEGETVVLPETQVTADQAGGKVAVVKGANLQMLVSGLNRMGLKPASIIAILQAIKSAGALQADLVVQ